MITKADYKLLHYHLKDNYTDNPIFTGKLLSQYNVNLYTIAYSFMFVTNIKKAMIGQYNTTKNN